MKLRAYPKYKESGVQWIGEVPEEWKLERFKIRFKTRKGKIPENLDVTNGNGYLPYLSMEYLRGKEENAQFSNDPTALKIEEGNLLLLWDGSNAGEFITAKKGILSSTMVKITMDRMNISFSKYLCSAFEPILRDLTVGMGIPHVNGDILGNIQIPIFEIENQQKIASFLDSKISQLNQTINKDGQLIELLKERRTALINHVVTKGFNPKTKMKNSGIEWIGKVPVGWEVRKLKYSCIINKKSLGEETNPSLNINYLDISNVNNTGSIISTEELYFEDAPSRARRVPDPKDTIISTVRTYLKAIAYLDNIPNKLIVSTGFAVLHPDKGIMPKHLFYVASSENFIQKVIADSTGVAYPAINPSDLGQINIILPPKSEQLQIVEYLDKATSKIDQTIQKIEEKITLMEEFKKSLIHHVVTGKADIMEAIA